jgi:hypothetical protein
MLLNLDLFRPSPPQDEAGGQDSNSNDSTLDQILTLDALGYLRNSDYMGAAAGATGEPQLPALPPSQETPE